MAEGGQEACVRALTLQSCGVDSFLISGHSSLSAHRADPDQATPRSFLAAMTQFLLMRSLLTA